MRRVAVALSGGIDSAVAALLLKRQGLHVEGVFMQNWDPRIESGQNCTVEEDYHYASRAANSLQIPLHRVNFVRQYWLEVFQPVLEGYISGRTPNPDLACNKRIKFGILFDWATQNEFDLLATGHYAKNMEYRSERWIGQASDLNKDQSYFLAAVPRHKLNQVLFPIGEIESKERVRRIASEQGLEFLLAKPESMGICFVGKRSRFSHFLSEFINPQSGEFVNIENNKVLGRHQAFEGYTIGQNIRLGGLTSKFYVVKKCLESKQIFVSDDKTHPLLHPKSISISPYFMEASSKEDKLYCSIRSIDKMGSPIERLKCSDTTWTVESLSSFFAPAPGQIAVIYRQMSFPLNTRIIVGCGEIKES